MRLESSYLLNTQNKTEGVLSTELPEVERTKIRGPRMYCKAQLKNSTSNLIVVKFCIIFLINHLSNRIELTASLLAGTVSGLP